MVFLKLPNRRKTDRFSRQSLAKQTHLCSRLQVFSEVLLAFWVGRRLQSVNTSYKV